MQKFLFDEQGTAYNDNGQRIGRVVVLLVPYDGATVVIPPADVLGRLK